MGIALLLQVFAAFGAARGLVLCVGPEGHVAIEDCETALRCQASQSIFGAEAGSASSAIGAPLACVDTPLLAASPVLAAAPELSASPARFAHTLMATAPVAARSRYEVLGGGGVWQSERIPQRARILGSVVLLV